MRRKLPARRKEILDSLATGGLGAEEAVKLLKQKWSGHRLLGEGALCVKKS